MKNWKSIALKKSDTIIHALEVLNTAATKFLIVVDEQSKLLGTVTDGDIRRSLLKGVQIQQTLDQVMNTKPKTAASSTSRAEIRRILKEQEIQYLPVLDDKGHVLEIISLTEVASVEKKENHVVLMAGGLGSRLAELTENCPKVMLNIGGRPILETIIETFKAHGFYKFIISVHYKSEMIEQHFKDGSQLNVEISYIKEKTRLGTAGALSLYKSNGLPFIVMNGDLLTKINFNDLVDFHLKHQNAATMCLRQYEHQIPFGVVVTEQDQVTKIEEKPIRRYFVNGGIYVLNPELLADVPENTYYDMPTFFENLIEKKFKVGAYPFYEYWIDIGRLDDYERAHAEFLQVFK
jgi:dTDP-glucose pyrophosphorylase